MRLSAETQTAAHVALRRKFSVCGHPPYLFPDQKNCQDTGSRVRNRTGIRIAMGGLGSDAAIEAADIVIMTDEPSKIAAAMRISRKTLAIVRQNIVFALGVKAVVLLLGALGIASMWAAVFADVGVAVIAILNAVRALRVPKEEKVLRKENFREAPAG